MWKPIGSCAICAGTLASLAIACSDSNGPGNETVFGSPLPVSDGGGSARTFLTLDPGGEPVDFGIAISQAAVDALPATEMPAERVLPLPDGASALPFDHVTIQWMPMGHPPPGVYDQPHFDFHFYTITTAQRDAITPADPAYGEKLARAPEAALIPESYIATPDGIPRMGRHWISTLAPEHNGQPFTRTLLYGFYDGEQIFLEPMVTRAFLETRQSVTETIGLPAAYSTPGFYPTSYAVEYDASAAEYRVVLRDFVRHD